jgi:hypothetical protein
MRVEWTLEELAEIINRDSYPFYWRLELLHYCGRRPRKILYIRYSSESMGAEFSFCDDTPENREKILTSLKTTLENNNYDESELGELVDYIISQVGDSVGYFRK